MQIKYPVTQDSAVPITQAYINQFWMDGMDRQPIYDYYGISGYGVGVGVYEWLEDWAQENVPDLYEEDEWCELSLDEFGDIGMKIVWEIRLSTLCQHATEIISTELFRGHDPITLAPMLAFLHVSSSNLDYEQDYAAFDTHNALLGNIYHSRQPWDEIVIQMFKLLWELQYPYENFEDPTHQTEKHYRQIYTDVFTQLRQLIDADPDNIEVILPQLYNAAYGWAVRGDIRRDGELL